MPLRGDVDIVQVDIVQYVSLSRDFCFQFLDKLEFVQNGSDNWQALIPLMNEVRQLANVA
jgi:hypothetical protein